MSGRVTSGVIDSATISTVVGSPTLVLNSGLSLTALNVQNASNQALHLLFGSNLTTDEITILPSQTITFEMFAFSRRVSGVVRARMAASATGSIVINGFL